MEEFGHSETSNWKPKCLLCQSKDVHGSQIFPSFPNIMEESGNSQLSNELHTVFFFLRILEIPSYKLKNYLKSGNPSGWKIRLCLSCSRLVDQAKSQYEMMICAKNMFRKTQQTIIETLRKSAETVRSGNTEDVTKVNSSAKFGCPRTFSQFQEEIQHFLKSHKYGSFSNPYIKGDRQAKSVLNSINKISATTTPNQSSRAVSFPPQQQPPPTHKEIAAPLVAMSSESTPVLEYQICVKEEVFDPNENHTDFHNEHFRPESVEVKFQPSSSHASASYQNAEINNADTEPGGSISLRNFNVGVNTGRKLHLPKTKIVNTPKPRYVPQRQFRCHLCGSYWLYKQSLHRHLAQAHQFSETAKYVCTFEGCGKRFASDYYLKRHMRTQRAHRLLNKRVMKIRETKQVQA